MCLTLYLDAMNKKVFISGAAQGIGRSTAELLAARGWIVGAYDIKDDFEWVENTTHFDGTIYHGHLDVTDPESWQEAIRDFTSRAGSDEDQLHALINNAGILYAGPFMEAGSYERDAALVDINVKGVLFGARASYPYLAATPDSKLVNVASAAAIYGTPDMAVYSASKFAVRGITEALDLEWDQENIDVVSVMPLYARTGMLEGVETSGTKKLGVKLSADDIAEAIAEVTHKQRSRPTKVHHAVGAQSKFLLAGSRFSPGFLTRLVNSRLVSDRKIRF